MHARAIPAIAVRQFRATIAPTAARQLRFRERFRHSLSFAMFCLLPIFAGLLALAYRRRRMYYGEHLVFALHVHSFWFFLAFATALLPDVIGQWLALPSRIPLS
jgi:hypothetical protein